MTEEGSGNDRERTGSSSRIASNDRQGSNPAELGGFEADPPYEILLPIRYEACRAESPDTTSSGPGQLHYGFQVRANSIRFFSAGWS
jgi:hypothetical protein